MRFTRCAALLIAAWAPCALAADLDQAPTVVAAAGPEADRSFAPASLPKVYDTLEVVGELPQVPVVTAVSIDELRQDAPYGDGAEALRSMVGVSLGRMGGHGLEPSVRGLAHNDLNVMLDGAFIHGGCPNRMDPQTSYGIAETYDQVVVVRGVQTLRFGGGGSGGTILYERRSPRFDEPFGWTADLSASFGSFLNGPDLGADLAVGAESWSLRAVGSRRGQGNYQDGDGREVRSSFETRSGAVQLELDLGDRTGLTLGVERTHTDDALFAGAGMDAPEDDATIYRLHLHHVARRQGGVRWSLRLNHAAVDHTMDNYSLRDLTAPMAMRAPSTSNTSNVSASAEWGGGRDQLWRIVTGVDLQHNERVATRYAGPTPAMVNSVQALLWPEVTTSGSGAFAEASRTLGPRRRITFGLRLDRLQADAAAARRPTMGGNGPSPLQLWRSYYRDVGTSWDDVGVGALARLEWFRDRTTFFVGLSRSVRAPDATERFLASNAAMAGMRWLGNPGLAAATHHQLDVGMEWSTGIGSVRAAAFGDVVDGAILRDRAHGQDGILAADGAFVYRNVDAGRIGAELEAMLRIGPRLMLDGQVAWVRAQNRTDDRPVAQTPPLEGRLSLSWQGDRLASTASLRWADRQTRVDADPTVGSGLDSGQTPGWAAFDLSGSLAVAASLQLVCGVNNVFDRTYATHLSRASLFDPLPVQVNEPGRSFWLRLRWSGAG